jgi:RimJ/RimL family protein N-acetyltransferase
MPAGRDCVVVVRGAGQPLARLSGHVGSGESLLRCARRLLSVDGRWQRLEPWPLDLSAEPAAFVCEASGTDVSVGFRPLTRADFRDVVAWQRQPHVSRWWQDEATDEAAAERHYGPALDGDDPTRLWVLEVAGRSVGMLQDYRVGDHPDYALLTAKPDAAALDYLIGDPAWVGRGLGTRMLWVFVRDVVHPGHPQARELFAAPDHRNAASLRVLDKIGFTRGLWFDEPQPDGRVDTVVGCTLDVPAVLG